MTGNFGEGGGRSTAKPPPLSTDQFLEAALGIVKRAQEEGLLLRMLGSIAIRLHCPTNVHYLDEMKRELTDVDFAGHGKQRHRYKAFFAGLGYQADEDILVATEGERFFFLHPTTGLGVDIFVDKLNFCHPIPLRDRLELDSPTITLADLILEKMQIVEINEKDLKDTFVLFLEHEVGERGGPEVIHSHYIAQVLAEDWGFYYTVTQNLEKLARVLPSYHALGEAAATLIIQRIGALRSAIEQRPKSVRWKLRARVGPRIKWYQDVAEKSAIF